MNKYLVRVFERRELESLLNELTEKGYKIEIIQSQYIGSNFGVLPDATSGFGQRDFIFAIIKIEEVSYE